MCAWANCDVYVVRCFRYYSGRPVNNRHLTTSKCVQPQQKSHAVDVCLALRLVNNSYIYGHCCAYSEAN